MAEVVAIIPARGGSKGIPNKNIIDFCGKPLIAWSIEQALNSNIIDSVWVTSDDEEILSVAAEYGANTILRPDHLSGDDASSESAWLHAVDYIEKQNIDIRLVFGIQATSPVRESVDFDGAFKLYNESKCDTLFTGSLIGNFFTWRRDGDSLKSYNYDFQNRKRRQELQDEYVENGSFYIFTPKSIRESENRLSGHVGIFTMPMWKSFEIDDLADVRFLSVIMHDYLEEGRYE